MPITSILCACALCQYQWEPRLRDRLPPVCPKCYSHRWLDGRPLLVNLPKYTRDEFRQLAYPDGTYRTLQAIGDQLGITRERVRQLKKKHRVPTPAKPVKLPYSCPLCGYEYKARPHKRTERPQCPGCPKTTPTPCSCGCGTTIEVPNSYYRANLKAIGARSKYKGRFYVNRQHFGNHQARYKKGRCYNPKIEARRLRLQPLIPQMRQMREGGAFISDIARQYGISYMTAKKYTNGTGPNS